VSGDQAPARLLLVEDDPDLAGMLEGLLAEEGYAVDVAPDGRAALHLGLSRPYDVLLIDRGLPAIEGLDLLGRLRRSGSVAPALVLSAQGSARDRVDGLDAGAEDYLGKPFDVDELLARLRALLRRGGERAEVLPVPHGRLEPASRCVTTDEDEVVSLSETESALLELLARIPRRVFSRADLLELVFAAAADEGAVDTYVHYLREKVDKGHARRLLHTVRGAGYVLRVP